MQTVQSRIHVAHSCVVSCLSAARRPRHVSLPLPGPRRRSAYRIQRRLRRDVSSHRRRGPPLPADARTRAARAQQAVDQPLRHCQPQWRLHCGARAILRRPVHGEPGTAQGLAQAAAGREPCAKALEARLRAHLLRHEPEILQRPERYLFAFGRFFKDLVTHHTMLTQWERSFRHVNVLAIELLSQQGSLRKLSRQYPGALAVPYPSNYVAPPWAATGSSPREPRRAAVAAAFGLEEGMDANLRLRAALREQCLRRHPQRRRSARGGASTACTWIPPPGGHAASMYSSSTSNVVLPAYESHAQPCCGNEWQGWTESRPPAPRGVPCERTVPLAHAGTACSQAATR